MQIIRSDCLASTKPTNCHRAFIFSSHNSVTPSPKFNSRSSPYGHAYDSLPEDRTGNLHARNIESRLFSSTPVFFSSTYCPHCRARHEWFVKDAWVCDSDWAECEFVG